jgi:beta-lactam-binding protein with PASTA domain
MEEARIRPRCGVLVVRASFMGNQEQHTVVPMLVGLPAATAHDVALDAQVLAVDQDPAHKPTEPGVVTAQQPRPGSSVATGHRVSIWVSPPGGEGGGGGGNTPVPGNPTPLQPAGAK